MTRNKQKNGCLAQMLPPILQILADNSKPSIFQNNPSLFQIIYNRFLKLWILETKQNRF